MTSPSTTDQVTLVFSNAAVWAAAIRSARFYLAQARAYRLRREAAQRAV